MTTLNAMREGSFEGVGGLAVVTREWLPAGKPHAVVVISYGSDAGSGPSAWAAEQFVSKGLAVYTLDHRGRDNVDASVADVAILIGMVKAREPGLPVFLLGHRAGGAIACRYALEHRDEITGLICESFAPEIPAREKEFPGITLPVLILQGTEDTTAESSGGKHLYEKAGSTDKMMKRYEGRHRDLLSDVGQQQVMTDIQNWIDAHLGSNAPRGSRELRA
jgi:alpha-beta hydrolase superfamily lysophospholipase